VKFAASLIVLALLQGASDASTSSPIGLWKTPVDEGIVRIEPCGQDLCGHIAGSAPLRLHPDLLDSHNHDPALRNRPLMGLLMLRLKAVGPNRWGRGWIYDPRDGSQYSAKLDSATDSHLRLSGCLAMFLCRSQTWTRAR
jgi:uncharacterized protein (DUF2147 family)